MLVAVVDDEKGTIFLVCFSDILPTSPQARPVLGIMIPYSKLIVKHAKISWESRANRLSQRPVSKNITPCLNYYNINDTPGYF